MPSLAAARAANAAYAPPSLPIAIFVGGTAGISKAIAHAFARHTNGNAHIVLIGRNKRAADAILDSFPKPSPPSQSSPAQSQWTHEFVACDATLMKNVDATTAALRARLPKLNYLVMSPGYFNLKGRDETEEGIDRRLALEYYARWKFTRDLVPLLQKAADAGEEAKVMTVLAAGSGQAIDAVEDFGIKNGYTVTKAVSVTSTYNDAMVKSFSERYPDIGFIHVHPGLVRTQIMQKSHWIWRGVYYVILPFYYPFSFSEEESGELLFSGLVKSGRGMSRLNGSGDDIGLQGFKVSSEDTKGRLWKHTEEVTEVK